MNVHRNAFRIILISSFTKLLISQEIPTSSLLETNDKLTGATNNVSSDNFTATPTQSETLLPTFFPSKTTSGGPSSATTSQFPTLTFYPSKTSAPSDILSSSPTREPTENRNSLLENVATLLDSISDTVEVVVEATVDAVRETLEPTEAPAMPTALPSDIPSTTPSDVPSIAPSDAPSIAPTDAPSHAPSDAPSATPSDVPSDVPSDAPSHAPSDAPSDSPSVAPSYVPSVILSQIPTITQVPSKVSDLDAIQSLLEQFLGPINAILMQIVETVDVVNVLGGVFGLD